MTGFTAGVGEWGGWVVYDLAGYPLPAVKYARRSMADKYADLLNAVNENEPAEVVARIRADLNEMRTGGR